LKNGTYTYWNIFKKHTFIVINLSDEDPISVIPASLLDNIPEHSCKRVTIKENERGFLFRNSRFLRMLPPGVHAVPGFLGYSCMLREIDDEPYTHENQLAIYGRDENFSASIVRVDVQDGHIALHYVDGRYEGVIEKGVYAFWRVFNEHTFRIIDTSDDSAIEDIPKLVLESIPDSICMRVSVEDWQAVLLYVNGALVRRLPSGSHFFWRNGQDISTVTYDMRATQLDVPGQEILTSDKVALRVNFVCSFRVSDPVQMHTNLKDYTVQLYSAAQLALRELLGGMKFDEVLEVKGSIASSVLELLRRREGELFVEFLNAGMKDIILPGEVRDIMNTVLVAEKKAQANVITRREEVASTRSLLNTARLMDENATLYKLKELEYLEKICDKVDSIKLNGATGLLEQLRAMIKA
jgi:regulator of protease activity HflC (stomatin/prohibitin superfamily)